MDCKKVILVGNKKTGKSYALKQLLGLPVSSHKIYIGTWGAEKYKYIRPDGSELELWDIGGDPAKCGNSYTNYGNARLAIVYTEQQRPGLCDDRTVEQWQADVQTIVPACPVLEAGTVSQLRQILDSV